MKFKLKDYNGMIENWSVYEPLTPKEAIKAKCLDCCCYSYNEAKICNIKSCPLYALKEIYFDNVKTEKKKRELTEEQLKELRARMQKAREANPKVNKNIRK